MNKDITLEDLGYERKESCYEYPLSYNKPRKTKNIYEVDEDSFAFYEDDKTTTIWKDGVCILLKYKEMIALMNQYKELGWLDE